MPCRRCAGLRVPDLLSDGGTRVIALRCLHCGDVVDEVISMNRRLQLAPKPGRARTPVYGEDRTGRRSTRRRGHQPGPLTDPCWFLLRRTPASV